MTYLAYIYAIVKVVLFTNTSHMSFNQGMGVFLNTAAGAQEFLFWVSLVIWAVISIVIVGTVLLAGKNLLSGITSLGCIAIPFAIYPLLQWLLWHVSLILANSWGSTGIIDPIKFWGIVILFLIAGLG
jgi:hypothetical protein